MIAATSNYITALAAFRSGKIPALITIAGYPRVFTNYDSGVGGQINLLTQLGDLSTSVHDLDGGADQSTWAFQVLDLAGLITSDFPGFVFEGKVVTLKLGLPGLAQADFCTVFTGYIDTVGSTNGNQEYVFNCSDISARLSQVIYLVGDSGLPTDQDNIRTLNGHPLDILLDILNTQVALPGGFIDTAKIEAYRDGPFSGAQFQFNLSQSVAAMDFIKNQLLKPLGGYLWVNSLGLITVNFFYPLAAPVAVATLGTDSWTSIPDAEQVDMINTVQFQFDKDDADKDGTNNYFAQDTELYGASVSKYGQYGETVIQADGLRSGFQGFFTARLVARMIFSRYGLKSLKFDSGAADAIWKTMRLEPGDIVGVTHPFIPNREAGTIGITSRLFEILNRSFKFSEGLMTFTMIDANFLTTTFGAFKIAPDAEADYVSASAPDKLLYMFMCNDSDQYSNGNAAHILG
jgi:hypothetical protein